jgi:uncharacterized protein YndB with AHSA1/START domain
MSVEDFSYEVTIAAPVEAVYEALASPTGIPAWWTTAAEVTTEVGGVHRLRWSEVDWTEIRVDWLAPPHSVDWSCTAAHMTDFSEPDEWVGTSISFELSEVEGGTRLSLVHHGLAALPCIEMCERGWRFHLGESLKALVESGRGAPIEV